MPRGGGFRSRFATSAAASSGRCVELVAATVPEALRDTPGHVLVFLPGVGEILRAQEALAPLAERQGLALLPLFGDLPAEQQDRVLTDLGQRKIILSTNVAETSLTIEGVTAVIDSGQARQLHVSPATGLPRLELVPISQASAEQRAGRAGRTAPGVCWRLWDESSHRGRPAAETPEVLRSDLAEPLLALVRARRTGRFSLARSAAGRGRRKCAAIVAAAGCDRRRGSRDAAGRRARAVAGASATGPVAAWPGRGTACCGRRRSRRRCLSERDPFRSAQHSRRGPRDYGTVRTRSDVVDRVVALQAFHAGTHVNDPDLELHPGGARNVLRAAEQLFHLADFPRAARAERPELALMQALLEAFPDRLAKLRPGTQDRALMVGGRGVRLDSSSRVRGEPLFLAIELNDAGGEARARLVSAVERSWLPAEMLRNCEELFFNPTRGQVEARARTYWADLLLEETPVAISDAAAAAALLAQEARQQFERVLPAADTAAGKFLARVRWLADARPDLAVAGVRSSGTRTTAAGDLPRPAIARRAARRRLARLAAGPRRLRSARGNRPARTGGDRTAQRQSARDRVRSRQDAGARGANSRTVRPRRNADDRRRPRAARACTCSARTTARNK